MLGVLGVLLVGLIVGGVVLAGGMSMPRSATGKKARGHTDSVTTTTGRAATPTSGLTTIPTNAASHTGPASATTTTAAPTTTSTAATTTTTNATTTAGTAVGNGCQLAVDRSGADTFTFVFTSNLGSGVTVAFTGGGQGHAVTDPTGTAAIKVSTGYALTGTTETEQESAVGGSCAAGPVTYLLPHAPGG